jgi:uncharacterized protein YcbK (DUF882 family)
MLRRDVHRNVDHLLSRVPGLHVSSTYRTPAHNRRVGGSPTSYHLRRRAVDVVGSRHEQTLAVLHARAHGAVEALDEGDHAHLAW